MDDWDDHFREPTEDERSARRALSLAIALINARRPISSTRIHREFYGGMSDATFRKTFLRDRERLLVAGLTLRKGPKDGDVMTWEVDEDSSFAIENALSQEDALVLDFLLLPLASDPSFPFARDLRLALTKIDRSFDGTSRASIPPAARRRNNNVSRLEDCMTAGHAARVLYRRADGTETKRVIAPYGFFFLHGTTYMVGARMDAAGDIVANPHTYNLDRMLTVQELSRTSYAIPVDFDVRDFTLLPFQMGPARYRAAFRGEDGVVEHDVHDEDVAVTWAIAEGYMPMSPPSLVEAWRGRLKSMVLGGENGNG